MIVVSNFEESEKYRRLGVVFYSDRFYKSSIRKQIIAVKNFLALITLLIILFVN